MTTKFYTTQFDPQWLLNAANPPSGEIFNMPTANGKTRTPSALLDAIDADAYDWLANHAPMYLAAIETELQRGMTPADIRNFMLRHIGPDRSGLALRAEQAARHLSRTTQQ